MLSDRQEICTKSKRNPKIRVGQLVQPEQETIKAICRYFGAHQLVRIYSPRECKT